MYCLGSNIGLFELTTGSNLDHNHNQDLTLNSKTIEEGVKKFINSGMQQANISKKMARKIKR